MSNIITREERRLRGLGDVVAAVTGAVGIKPCGPCNQRREILNNLIPFQSRQPTQPQLPKDHANESTARPS